MKTVADVLDALDALTGGRVIKTISDVTTGNQPFVIMKSSGIPGKEVLEMPGVVYGDLSQEVRKIAVTMTMTEGSIELAGATGVDVIIAHHPIADASNSGGVELKNYLDLYEIAVFELHEAFHGLHPGLSYLHGHKAYRAEITYGGVHGNILFVGQALPEVRTLGDMLQRLRTFMGLQQEEDLLVTEREIRGSTSLTETSMETLAQIVLGDENSPVEHVLHIFPHTGFRSEHLRMAVEEHPEADTLLASISRVYGDNELISTARELGLNFIIGNCHTLEILENGLPLAYALNMLLPEIEIVVFRERITSSALHEVGTPEIKTYAREMAANYLVHKATIGQE